MITARLRGGPRDGELIPLQDEHVTYFVAKPQVPIFMPLAEGNAPVAVSCVTGRYVSAGPDPTTMVYDYQWAGWDGPEQLPAPTARQRLSTWLDDTSWVDAYHWSPELEAEP